jgi:hypothetical protein
VVVAGASDVVAGLSVELVVVCRCLLCESPCP